MAERFRTAPPLIWIPLASAVALILPGAIAAVTHRLFLFASLGPTAVIAAQQPELPSARAYNAFVGHAIGLAVGCGSVFAFGLSAAPSVFQVHAIGWPRAGAAIIAVLIASLVELALRAQHPPAASTTLLVALGSFRPTWGDAGLVLGGVALVAAASELLRRLRLQ